MKVRTVLRKLQTLSGGRPPRRRMPGFDATYYLYWYRDVAQYRDGPLEHYLAVGWKEGRDPSAGFSTDGYLSANPDVKAGGTNPLIHFVEHGLAEGRRGWEKDFRPPPRPRYLPVAEPQKLLPPPSA